MYFVPIGGHYGKEGEQKWISVSESTQNSITMRLREWIFSDAEAMKDRQLKRHVKFTRYSDLSDGECCHDVIERR